jgi:hypothetical protein
MAFRTGANGTGSFEPPSSVEAPLSDALLQKLGSDFEGAMNDFWDEQTERVKALSISSDTGMYKAPCSVWWS